MQLVETYLRLHNPDEIFKKIGFVFSVLKKLKSIGISDETLMGYTRRINYALYRFFFRSSSNIGENVYHRLVNLNLSNLDYDNIKLQLARRLFNEKKYQESYHYYKQVNKKWSKWNFFGGEDLRVKTLKKITELKESNRKEYIFNIAMLFKRTVFDSRHSIPYLEEYIEKYANENEIPKLLMLKAFCYRNVNEGQKMIKILNTLTKRYPDHHFADDAMAEIGVYFLLRSWKRDKGREILQKVIDKYPNHNATDNCYNWIAWSYLKDQEYHKAFNAYVTLLNNVGYSRFADYAFRNLPKLVQKDPSYKRTYLRLKQKFGINYKLEVNKTQDYKRSIKIVFDNGTIKELDRKFSTETKILDFRIEENNNFWIAWFKAFDHDWKVQYSWDLKKDNLYFQAVEKRTGIIYKSQNLKFKVPLARYINSQHLKL